MSGENWAGDPNWNGGTLVSLVAAQKFAQASIKTPTILTGTTTSNLIFNTTECKPVYREEYEVSKIVKRHTNKDYFYVISVSDTDDVFYQIWEGGWFSMLLFKAMGDRNGYRKTNVNASRNTQWDAVRKRTHLPATIGATYLEIDDAIEKHIEDSKVASDHDNYAEELLKTEPDNLKMIQGLEKLAEGEPEADPQHGTTIGINQGNVGGGTYSNNIATAPGSGALYVSSSPTPDNQADSLQYDTLDDHGTSAVPEDEDCDEFVRYVGR